MVPRPAPHATGGEPSSPGPPPCTVVGVDIGGTKIAAGVLTGHDPTLWCRRVIPTRAERGSAAVLNSVEQLILELKQAAGDAGHPIQRIGLGVCELVDPSGHIVSRHRLDWPADMLARRLSPIAPTVIEADVRAAARAEAVYGAGRGARVLLYITIGTGIASCLVIDGRPFTGARGASGTMASGPLPLPDAGGKPAWPHRGSLEDWAAGPGLVQRLNQYQQGVTSGQEVLEAARAGDAQARSVVQSAAHLLGGTIGWLVNVLDPERVVLGGGLGAEAPLYFDLIASAIRQHVWWDGHRDLPILPAKLGADSGVIGAALRAQLE